MILPHQEFNTAEKLHVGMVLVENGKIWQR